MFIKEDSLKLENQLCFPLYACAKELVKKYNPLLEKLDLTYTQFIAMMVMWERKNINVKDLGKLLYLDSGTLTPLLKKLENKGYIIRERSKDDERVVNIGLTEIGDSLKQKALAIPECIKMSIYLEEKEVLELYRLLYKVLDGFKETE